MWGQGSKINVKVPEPRALDVDQRPGQVSKTFLQCDGTIGCKLERLFLEAWYSKRDNNAGNDHIDIPDIYESLA